MTAFHPPEGKREKYLLLEDGDGISVNHKFPIFSLHSAFEVTMSRVILEHVNLERREEGWWWEIKHPSYCLYNPCSAYESHLPISSVTLSALYAALGSAEALSSVPSATSHLVFLGSY